MNRLTAHVTTWRAWYAVLAMSAFVLSSFAAVAGAAFTPLSFLLFAALSLLFIAVASRRWPPASTSACAADSPCATSWWSSWSSP